MEERGFAVYPFVCYKKGCKYHLDAPTIEQVVELEKNKWRCPKCGTPLVHQNDPRFCPFCDNALTPYTPEF